VGPYWKWQSDVELPSGFTVPDAAAPVCDTAVAVPVLTTGSASVTNVWSAPKLPG
jgi:hypothetical protein